MKPCSPLRLLSFAVLACGLFTSPLVRAADMAVAFSPGQSGQNAEALVLTAIDDARQSIHLAAYSFTSKSVAAALVRAASRGVSVQVLLDKSVLKERYSGATFLINAGIPVRINSHYSSMHHKFMVIDATSVQTGSFNYTTSAARHNAENVILIRGIAGVARDYLAEWTRLWDESDPQ